MSNNIDIGDISKAVNECLSDYSDEVLEAINTATVKYTKQAVKDIKKNSPKLSGKYQKGWTSNINKSRTSVVGIVFNKSRYQIAHLLEKGHVNRNGGRTEGVKHISPVEEQIKKDFEQEIIKLL